MFPTKAPFHDFDDALQLLHVHVTHLFDVISVTYNLMSCTLKAGMLWVSHASSGPIVSSSASVPPLRLAVSQAGGYSYCSHAHTAFSHLISENLNLMVALEMINHQDHKKIFSTIRTIKICSKFYSFYIRPL